jgi:hypothetical protein
MGAGQKIKKGRPYGHPSDTENLSTRVEGRIQIAFCIGLLTELSSILINPGI